MISKQFMINNEVIFDVDGNELYSLVDKQVTVSLNAPTARCLRLLIESKGGIISRDEFLAKVWNARGLVVSQNTFYQNISLLRKSLEKAGLSKDIIVTIRQRGFMLATDIEIALCPEVDSEHKHVISVGVDQKANTLKDNSYKSVNLPGTDNRKLRIKKLFNASGWVLIILIILMAINAVMLLCHAIY